MNNEKEQLSVLYIEDEKKIKEDYLVFLKRQFECVYEASDGENGLEIYKDKKPDILLIDINLPILNGIDVVREIRKNDHSIRIIILTAHSDKNYLMQAISLKLTTYLVKPVNRQQLKDALTLAVEEIDLFETKGKKTFVLNKYFQWSFDRKELINNNISIKLTAKEQLFLNQLFLNNKQVLTYESIIINLWEYEAYEDDKTNALKTIVKNLRKKLPENTITNIFGIGYKLGI